MNLEKDIITDISNKTAKEIAEEIDWEILTDILNDTLGWTKIRINNNDAGIYAWLEVNCYGKYKTRGNCFVFENKTDAEWFLLRWQ